MKREQLAAVNPHIRWMIRRDMPEVLEIEQLSFEFPWSENDFTQCLKQRNCIGVIAEASPNPLGDGHLVQQSDAILGFMLYELLKDRLHVLNFAVHPSCQHRGIGSAMVAKLVGKLSPNHRKRVMLEVRESNLDALLFWKAQGFRAITLKRNFYRDTEESAVLMQYRLPVKALAEASA